MNNYCANKDIYINNAVLLYQHTKMANVIYLLDYKQFKFILDET